MAEELKTCPACFSEAEIIKQSDAHAQAVFCTKCPLGVEDNGWTTHELVELWNRLPRDND